MGTTLEDVAYEMAMNEQYQEQYLEELYEKHTEEFTAARLRSYFLNDPKVAETAVKALETAKSLLNDEYYTPALIYAAIAQEITVKSILLEGIVYGLINNDTAASIITKFAIGYGSPSKFQELIFALLTENGGVNLGTEKRTSSTQIIWAEITHTIKQRNDAVHKGKIFTMEEAQAAIDISEDIINRVFRTVIENLGLHLHEYEICDCETPDN